MLLQSFISDIFLTVCLELFLFYFPWVKFLALCGLDKACIPLKLTEEGRGKHRRNIILKIYYTTLEADKCKGKELE